MGNIETLEHCLNLCTWNMPAMQARHNCIVDRLSEAIPSCLGIKYLDQTAPHCEGQGRPDIVILNEEAKKAYLVDVVVPWGSEDNLKASRNARWKSTRALRTLLNRRALRCVLRTSLSDPSEPGTQKTTPS